MKEQLRLNGAASLLSLALLLLGTWVRAQNNIPTGRRAITIADIIETTWVETHGEGSDTRPHPAWFSPDGKKFVVSLTKGNVKQNTNDTTLLLYNTADVLHSPKPDILTTMSSSSSREGINEVRWTDNNTLVFLGEEPGVMPQIYTLNVETKHLEKLTSESKRITMFDITPDGHEAVYKADLPLKNGMSDDQMRSGAVTITDQRLGALLKGIYAPLTFDAQLFAQQHNRRPRLIRPVNVPPTSGTLSLSPDGKHALVLVALYGHELKKSWTGYDFGAEADYLQGFFAPSSEKQLTPFLRWLLIDMRTGLARPLLDTPFYFYGRAPVVTWKSHGQRVFLAQAYLPLDVTDLEERKARIKNRYDVEVNVQDGQYRRASESELPAEKKPDLPVDVTLEQDVGTPPKLSVLDLKSNQRATLLDPNPQFSALQFGPAETIVWEVAEGCEVRGGLYLPPNHAPGKKYPLVIQTHGYRPEWFTMDGKGQFNSGYAARALAAKNLIVLQTYAFADDTDGEAKCKAAAAKKLGISGQEVQVWKRFEMFLYESAIKFLDKKRLIDPDKVGIMGFSRTVCYAGFALTHSKQHFAAALLVDGIDCGYFQYIAYGSNAEEEQINGGSPPFGDGLSEWMKEAPGFNLDKISTPVRLEAHGERDAGGVMSQWEWFQGLLRLGKPVEYILLPEAGHMIAQPRERMISQGGAVDWFCFWLKGEEDPNPAKAEQYKRWRELRKMQEENDTKDKARPPRNPRQ